MVQVVRPFPAPVLRWSRRARWLRGFDAVAAWLVVWAGAVTLAQEASRGALGVAAALAVTLGAAVPWLRMGWRPITGLTALMVSWRLRPGQRAWWITAGGGTLVVVTACRAWRVVLAGVSEDPTEGIAVRRTRALLLPIPDRRGPRRRG